MYLSYTGIRVTNLEKSLEFYTKLFGLKEVARGDNSDLGGGTYVLLKDEESGQKLELNWYPAGSQYGTPYTPGDGLDHVAFGVDDVAKTIKELSERGVGVAQIPPSLGEQPGLMRNPTDRRTHIAYVKDPDGNWVELYTHPGHIGAVIPESY
jgi:lactoylglutathione lyase